MGTRAWLRHTPYLSGKGRLKKHNPLFRRPVRFSTPHRVGCVAPSDARGFCV
ncbi:hypothetical protein [Kingella potus]|uniref:hypothetical protein n=1 Tax=Kingella potus TaxID=265175 RepID=UPI001FD0D166|nr:hypothetical protein [Kingella potus]UOP01057.1 hypothetical protein LVJ84_01415 [Kingella potus]